MRTAVVAVALLLVTSGCSALLGPSSGEEETPTLTPAPAPTPEATYPPGVRPDSVSAFGLLDGHAAALSGQSYTVVETRTLRGINGSVRATVTERTSVAAGGRRYHHTRTVGGHEGPLFVDGATRLAVYSNGSVAVRRLVAPDGSTDDSVLGGNETVVQGLVRDPDGSLERPNAVRHGTPRNVDWLGSLIARSTFRVDQDGARYRLNATSVDGETLVVAGRQIENVTVGGLSLVVTPKGLVERAHLEFQGSLGGVVVTGVETLEYRNYGNTTVREPPWFESAVTASRD